MSVLVEFSMFPTDKGESVSRYVSRIIKMIDQTGIPYRLTPMGTVFEVNSIEEALEIINSAYKQLEPDCNRVYSVVKFDIRKGRTGRLEQKIKSVEEKLGKKVKK
ncbi:MTH1187 family thiamine-binding protein [Persephonella atlantica]|uniref:MTH1187 family thiamine-binding protein n=1 Tax=Persephonella atlantica TaxID=2699429 RepID=A0ABS1GGF9_9AQUI|nr:MTH1187 family thiamine-binding protein [Persephonella atlantica]MBK3332011.1 MTH1187 family thiamine-binding protein [Persephonella atlantica]